MSEREQGIRSKGKWSPAKCLFRPQKLALPSCPVDSRLDWKYESLSPTPRKKLNSPLTAIQWTARKRHSSSNLAEVHPESELSVKSGGKRCTLTRSCSFGSFDDTASEQPLWDGNFLDDQQSTASGMSEQYMSCEDTLPTKLEYSGLNESHGRCHSLDVRSDDKECDTHSGEHALGFLRMQSHPVSLQGKTPMTVKNMLRHPFYTVRMKIRKSRSHRNLTQIHSAKPTLDTSNSPSNDSKRLTLTRSCSVDGLDQQVTHPNKISIKSELELSGESGESGDNTLTQSRSSGISEDTPSEQPLQNRNRSIASGMSKQYMNCENTPPIELEYSGLNESHGRCHSLDVRSDDKECDAHTGERVGTGLASPAVSSCITARENTHDCEKLLKHPFATVRMKMRGSRTHKSLGHIHYELMCSNDNKQLTLTRSCSVDGLAQQLPEDSSMRNSEGIDDSLQVDHVMLGSPEHKYAETEQPVTQRQHIKLVSTTEKTNEEGNVEVKHATLKRAHSVDTLRDPQIAEHNFSLVQSDTHGKSVMRSKRSFHSSSSCILNEDKKDSELKNSLFKPKSPQQLIDVLESRKLDVNKWDVIRGIAPIHKIVMKKRKERAEILLALLTHSNADVNLQSRRRDTALHLAVEQGDEICVKVLISFGADINQPGSNEFTPLDLAINHGKVPKIEDALLELGARSSVVQLSKMLPENQQPAHEKESETIRNQRLLEELQFNLNRCMSLSKSFGGADEAVAIYYQQKEIAQYNKTLHRLSPGSLPIINKGGKRLLFLDGGGIKGLVEIEILMHIEERTGRRITELFDWIVGTSTGGIIALALVYAKKTLQELRQLFFVLKDKVFANARLGFAYSSKVLESILKDALGEMRMDEVRTPKVMISAVNKSTTLLELHFFSNCLDDEYSTAPVWKVARYTSAAPMFFSECDNYVDGGVLINNPCETGLTTIQNYYRKHKQKVQIAVVVSVGTGVYPPEKLGKVDAQKFLFFGTHWFNMPSLMKRAQNLMLLLSNALVESEMVASNCESRCKEQSIPYFRFSPKLDDVIAAGETDTEKLVNMIMQTKIQSNDRKFEDLISLLLET